jgi:hypothetical protein
MHITYLHTNHNCLLTLMSYLHKIVQVLIALLNTIYYCYINNAVVYIYEYARIVYTPLLLYLDLTSSDVVLLCCSNCLLNVNCINNSDNNLRLCIPSSPFVLHAAMESNSITYYDFVIYDQSIDVEYTLLVLPSKKIIDFSCCLAVLNR